MLDFCVGSTGSDYWAAYFGEEKNQNRHTQTTNPNQAESLMDDAIETGSRRNGEKRVVGFLQLKVF